MNFVEVLGPFALIAGLLISVIAIYLRPGRNHVLEEMIEKGEVGSIASFRGTLAVEENRSRFFLRLRKDSEGRRLQFLYRWLIGVGRQAAFDEITFDGSRRSVELTKNNKHKIVPFSEFSAIRIRETAGKYASVWRLDV